MVVVREAGVPELTRGLFTTSEGVRRPAIYFFIGFHVRHSGMIAARDLSGAAESNRPSVGLATGES
jgi:hypothetical protein